MAWILPCDRKMHLIHTGLAMGKSPQSLQSLFHTATPEIADMLGRARFLAHIRQALLERLPASAADKIQVAAYEKHRLRLHVDSSAWAMRLRYMERQLCQVLAQRMRLQVDSIQVKVRSTQLTTHNQSRRARYLSQATRAHLEGVARHVEDPNLASALQNLAAAGRSQL